MKYTVILVAAGLALLAAGDPVSAGPNPNVKFAMHLVASDAYLTCDDLTPPTWMDINGSLTIEELAVSNYCGYITFIAYDLGSCFHCVEYFVTGWPMSRGSPTLAEPAYCLETLVLGNPIEAHGGWGGLACLVGHTCLGDPVTHLAPFASAYFDLSAHTDYLPIEVQYSPSPHAFPGDPRSFVLGPEPDFIEDPTVQEKGCVIGTGDEEQIIELIAPDGSETLYVGATPPIEWTATGVQTVKLEYSSDGGGTWHEIVASMPSSRFYLWTVPDDLSEQCLVRISDATDGTPSDVSGSFFEIAQEYARTVQVPADYPTIQYGIYAAAPDDTVRVAPGTYCESVNMKDCVALLSEGTREETVIDATGHYHGVAFGAQIGTALIDGFTITGGDACGQSGEDQTGGGIHVVCTDAIIRNCVVEGNRANLQGGGIG